MSHFSRIKTKFVEQEHLIQALKDQGYQVEAGGVNVSGVGSRMRAELKIRLPLGREVGFRKNGDSYEMVLDQWGLVGFNRDKFLAETLRRYAYHTALSKLRAQGFELAQEEEQKDGQVRLTLRRMV